MGHIAGSLTGSIQLNFAFVHELQHQECGELLRT